MSGPAKKMIVLMSSDNETFEVEDAVAVLSQTIKHLIDDDCVDTAIPLPNVTSDILARVLEYCKKHTDSPAADKKSDHHEEALKKFDEDFVKVDQGTLFDLILAANYLDIKSLLDKTPEEIRTNF